METQYEWDFTKCNGQTPYLEIYADNNTCCPLPRSDSGNQGIPPYRPPPTPHSDSPLVSWGPINTPLQLVKSYSIQCLPDETPYSKMSFQYIENVVHDLPFRCVRPCNKTQENQEVSDQFHGLEQCPRVEITHDPFL